MVFVVRFFGRLVAFLLVDEAPNFIALDILHRNVHDQAAHELFALLAGQHEHFHDRVAIDSGDALRAADASCLR